MPTGVYERTEKARALLSRARMGKSSGMKGKVSHRRGVTYEEEYGIERAKELKKRHSESISGEKHPMYGKSLSEVTKERISKKMLGRQISKMTRIKMSAIAKGKPKTDLHKQNISIGVQKICNDLSEEEGKRRVRKMNEATRGVPKPHVSTCQCPFCEAKRGERFGKAHPNWQNGVSFEPYGFEFNGKLKLKIRQRDNFSCQLCPAKENGKHFVPHHINYDKTDNEERNFILLCGSCNSKANFDREKWQFLFESLMEVRNDRR